MKKVIVITVLFIASLLAGTCLANNANMALLLMSKSERCEVLSAALYEVGYPCRVIQVQDKGKNDSEDTAYWDVLCSNGRGYVVAIYANGSHKVMTCGLMERLTGTKCFEKF